MNVVGRHVLVSVLLLIVCFLALMPLSPASTGTLKWSSRNPSFTHAHSWQSGTWSRTWGTFSRTWNTAWHTNWSRTWSNTWSRRTHAYPTYTTEYVPYPVPSCDPNNPYCNGYGYYPPQTVNTYCYPNNPYCYPSNPYSPTQTVTVPPPAYQTFTQLTSQTVMVTQTGSPNFFLSAWPSTVSLPPNNFVGSTNFILTVTSVGGWSGDIQFTTSTLPQGITLSNVPPPVYQLNSPTAGWNVQVTIDASARTGNYLLVITGVSGSLIQSVAVTISVTNPNNP